MDTLPDLLRRVTRDRMGFLDDEAIASLARMDRLRQILVRCGGCRFVCAAQDTAHLIAMVEASGADYVRDVSLPSSDPAHRGDFHQITQDPITAAKHPGGAYIDNPPVGTTPPPAHHAPVWQRKRFDVDGDYGGAFDGFSVTSDADSGL